MKPEVMFLLTFVLPVTALLALVVAGMVVYDRSARYRAYRKWADECRYLRQQENERNRRA